MSKDNQNSFFYRLTGEIAWLLFWGIIGSMILVLKIYFRFATTPRSNVVDEKMCLARIAFCENGAGYGGAIISLATFLGRLPKQYQAYIYTSIGTEQYQCLSELGKWRHVPVITFISRNLLNRLSAPLASKIDNACNLLPYALRYYFNFKRDKISCVYLNNDASCNFAAAIAAKFSGLPLVLHARGFNADTKGNRWVLSRLDHCIAVSSAVKDELLRLGLPEGKCTIVPEGLDLEIFYPRPISSTVRDELGISAEQPIITLVGGLIDWKGQDVLLDAAPAIFKAYPSAIILLVGGAYGRDSSYAKMIRQRTEKEKLFPKVRLLGMRDDIPDILASSNIVVHASTKPEPFGRTFLEGMALGRAVIASNEGGPLDVITHRIDGILIEPRNPAILAEAINMLLSDPVFQSELGERAAVKATLYSIESHANSISILLKRILRKNSGLQPAVDENLGGPELNKEYADEKDMEMSL